MFSPVAMHGIYFLVYTKLENKASGSFLFWSIFFFARAVFTYVFWSRFFPSDCFSHALLIVFFDRRHFFPHVVLFVGPVFPIATCPLFFQSNYFPSGWQFFFVAVFLGGPRFFSTTVSDQFFCERTWKD